MRGQVENMVRAGRRNDKDELAFSFRGIERPSFFLQITSCFIDSQGIDKLHQRALYPSRMQRSHASKVGDLLK